jgi:hypothetical protein
MFLYHLWLELPIQTRHKIAAQFNIPKKGATEVFDNQIKSDGYFIKDIEQLLNVDAIQKYTESNETDMMTLWLYLVAKAEGREIQNPNIDTTIILPEKIKNGEFEKEKLIVKKKSGRPKKNG